MRRHDQLKQEEGLENIDPNDPLEKVLRQELKENVTEYPRTDWGDLEITKDDSVRGRLCTSEAWRN